MWRTLIDILLNVLSGLAGFVGCILIERLYVMSFF